MRFSYSSTLTEGVLIHLLSLFFTVFLNIIALGTLFFISKTGLAGESGKGKEDNFGKKEPIQFIPATLVKLGTPPDPDGVLHRKVPALATGPKDKIPVSTELNVPKKNYPEDEKAPMFAVEDSKIRKVFEKARAFAEITDNPAIEGLPDGVPEGEVTDPSLVKAGNIYATKLYRIFKEMWVVPSYMSQKEIESLMVKVRVIISPDLKISDYKLVKKSGNSGFDASVIEIFKKFETEGRSLPEPPDEIASKLFEGGLEIRFYGKDFGK